MLTALISNNGVIVLKLNLIIITIDLFYANIKTTTNTLFLSFDSSLLHTSPLIEESLMLTGRQSYSSSHG